MRLVIVGDVLLDRDLDATATGVSVEGAPQLAQRRERRRPGGAGLAAAIAVADGHEVALLGAVGSDEVAHTLRDEFRHHHIELIEMGPLSTTPEKTRIFADGTYVARLDRGTRTSFDPSHPLPSTARAALQAADAVLVSCYGYGVSRNQHLRAALEDLPHRRIVWDPHPRGPAPVRGCRLVAPNSQEARLLAPETTGTEHHRSATITAARAIRRRWHAQAIAVTAGSAGAVFVGPDGRTALLDPPHRVTGDCCGAGDRFATAAAAAVAEGADPLDAVAAAVHRATRFLADGGVSTLGAVRLPDTEPDELAAVRRTTRMGGVVTVVTSSFATMGAEEVARLERARAGTDHLVVGVIPDGDRNGELTVEDRLAVLGALRCVDTAVVYDAVNAGALDELLQAVPVGHRNGSAIHRSAMTVTTGPPDPTIRQPEVDRERSHAS